MPKTDSVLQWGRHFAGRDRHLRFVAPHAAFVLLLLGLDSASAQTPAATNHVLELDGGYLELPPNIFNNLTQATVEAWVRWDDFSGSLKRVFDYGDALQDMSLTTYDTTPGDTAGLGFALCRRLNGEVTRILRKGAFSTVDLIAHIQNVLGLERPLQTGTASAPGPAAQP